MPRTGQDHPTRTRVNDLALDWAGIGRLVRRQTAQAVAEHYGIAANDERVSDPGLRPPPPAGTAEADRRK
ncbi:MAG: hypothetical protein J5J06_08245 [Phycisphaerae bacterium]|nr:hypothetical protein [Phycisphaerae bacterium]